MNRPIQVQGDTLHSLVTGVAESRPFPGLPDPKGEAWWLDMQKDFCEKVPLDGL